MLTVIGGRKQLVGTLENHALDFDRGVSPPGGFRRPEMGFAMLTNNPFAKILHTDPQISATGPAFLQEKSRFRHVRSLR